jgi:hypothetical protein
VISAAVLKAARTNSQESRTEFAQRAGVEPDVAAGAEDGTRPTWALSYVEFAALSDAVSAVSLWMRGMFETAAACDLLLSCIMNGDQVFATDTLTNQETRDLAAALLQWAITGGPRGSASQLLRDAQVALLREKAAALAVSGSPDARVGAEILSLCRGERS